MKERTFTAKRLAIISFAVLVIGAVIPYLLLYRCACTIESKPDYESIARKEYGYTDIYAITLVNSEKIADKTWPRSHYSMFVWGVCQSNELLIVIPQNKKDKPFTVEWQLCKSFREIATQIYNEPFEQIREKLTDKHGGYNAMTNLGFYSDCEYNLYMDNEELMSLFGNRAFDTEFVIVFEEKYAAAQLNGEIVIYTSARAF